MSATKFQKLITNPITFRLYLLKKLPIGLIAGLKVTELNNERSVVTVRYKWMTQNPFKSMYFACQAMAAEMSTGAMVMNGIYNSDPAVSMLIVKNTAQYHKKAVGKITFICNDGKLIAEHIKKAQTTGESVSVETTSVGKNEAGEVVSDFTFTWSVKVKTKK